MYARQAKRNHGPSSYSRTLETTKKDPDIEHSCLMILQEYESFERIGMNEKGM